MVLEKNLMQVEGSTCFLGFKLIKNYSPPYLNATVYALSLVLLPCGCIEPVALTISLYFFSFSKVPKF